MVTSKRIDAVTDVELINVVWKHVKGKGGKKERIRIRSSVENNSRLLFYSDNKLEPRHFVEPVKRQKNGQRAVSDLCLGNDENRPSLTSSGVAVTRPGNPQVFVIATTTTDKQLTEVGFTLPFTNFCLWIHL